MGSNTKFHEFRIFICTVTSLLLQTNSCLSDDLPYKLGSWFRFLNEDLCLKQHQHISLGTAVGNKRGISCLFFQRNTAASSFRLSYDLILTWFQKESGFPYTAMRFRSLLKIKEYFLFYSSIVLACMHFTQKTLYLTFREITRLKKKKLWEFYILTWHILDKIIMLLT